MKAMYSTILISILIFGCADGLAPSVADEKASSGNEGQGTASSMDDLSNYFSSKTETFTVPAGEERFLCYTFTLEEDLTVDQWVYKANPVIHHLIVAETMGDEPDGFSDCDVLFRATWFPYFMAGSADTVIDAPKGSGYVFEKGTRMLIHFHLLNAGVEDATEDFTINLRRSENKEVDPIGMMVFGTMNLSLPPNGASTVTDTCQMSKDVEIFTVWPHMHYLGTSMVVEHGSSEEELKEIYRRDPWDFDNQQLDSFELSLAKGDILRVSCTYDNTTEEVVSFGESTLNEMCFLITYITGTEGGIDACMGTGSGGYNFFPEECGKDEPNEMGIGGACTEGGGECAENLLCSHDMLGPSGPGLCLGLNICETSADCGGGGAICCTPAQYDTINLCLPEGCEFPGCEAKK